MLPLKLQHEKPQTDGSAISQKLSPLLPKATMLENHFLGLGVEHELKLNFFNLSLVLPVS